MRSNISITKANVDALQPRQSEYCAWDTRLPGFGVRVRPTGSKTYLVVYRAGTGRTAPFRRFTIGATDKLAPDAARNQAKVLLGAVAAGKDPAAEKRASRAKADEISFDELAQRYLDEYAKPNKSSWQNDEGYLKRPRAKWKHRRASRITDDDVAELLDVIALTAPVSANRTQSVMHKMFSWAKQPGRRLVQHNPLADLDRRGGKEKTRDRVLSDDEIRTLWHGLDRHDLPADRNTALALKFILTTMVRPYQAAAARLSELSGLDTVEANYSLPASRVKNRHEVIIPLSELDRPPLSGPIGMLV